MTEFDVTSERYGDLVQDSIAFTGQEHGYFVRRKAEALVSAVRRHHGDPAMIRAIDVGCGVGTSEPFLAGAFGHLDACDPSIDSAARGAETVEEDACFLAAAGSHLPMADDSYDVAFTVNVLHHVEPGGRDAILAEMARVVRPGGLVAVFEHNPLNPLTRISVARCEFDEGVELLGASELTRRLRKVGLGLVERRYVIFTPFDPAWQHRIEDRLGRLPLGAQHYAVGRVGNRSAEGAPGPHPNPPVR